MNCLYCVFEKIIRFDFQKTINYFFCTSAAAASDASTTAAFSPSATLIAALFSPSDSITFDKKAEKHFTKKNKIEKQGFNLPIDVVYVRQQLPIPLHLQHSHSEQFLEPIIVIFNKF